MPERPPVRKLRKHRSVAVFLKLLSNYRNHRFQRGKSRQKPLAWLYDNRVRVDWQGDPPGWWYRLRGTLVPFSIRWRYNPLHRQIGWLTVSSPGWIYQSRRVSALHRLPWDAACRWRRFSLPSPEHRQLPLYRNRNENRKSMPSGAQRHRHLAAAPGRRWLRAPLPHSCPLSLKCGWCLL